MDWLIATMIILMMGQLVYTIKMNRSKKFSEAKILHEDLILQIYLVTVCILVAINYLYKGMI